jgi:hypothetical protein
MTAKRLRRPRTPHQPPSSANVLRVVLSSVQRKQVALSVATNGEEAGSRSGSLPHAKAVVGAEADQGPNRIVGADWGRGRPMRANPRCHGAARERK